MLQMVSAPPGPSSVVGPVDLTAGATFDLSGNVLGHNFDLPRCVFEVECKGELAVRAPLLLSLSRDSHSRSPQIATAVSAAARWSLRLSPPRGLAAAPSPPRARVLTCVSRCCAR
jgi:hypothetical protein